MKKGQVLEGIVVKTSFPNKGKVQFEDGMAEVKNVIDGQTVSVLVTKSKKGKTEGRLLEVVKKSNIEREEPFCIHFKECGGCTYQNLEYDTQLKLKEKQMRSIFEPVLEKQSKKFDEVYEGIKSSPRQFEYRNKMEFTFGDSEKGGPLTLGMHKRGSFYDIVTTDSCKIIDADYRMILKFVRDYMAEAKVPFLHRLTHIGYLRHLLIRKAVRTEEILVDLITTTQTELLNVEEETLLKGFCDGIVNLPLKGKLSGVLHTKNDSLADIVTDQGTDILYGRDYFYEEILNLKFKISPFSFFQTNSLGAEVLYETARDFIADSSKDATVFDLYSGTGTIAQMMASVAKKVVGVEIVEEAVEAAKVNASLNNLSNCEFIAGDVLKVIDTISEKPDFIVLDPPRDGIHPKALTKILKYNVDKMIYISCKPTSLARDLEAFLYRGYEVKRLALVDMFPGTYHVETIALIERIKNAKDFVQIGIDAEEYYKIKDEDKHKRDAKNGWYRYDSRLALPVYDDKGELERYNVFHASMLVRHSNDGKLYLYDVIDIKKETSNSLGE
ncbi:MAG: 23S rRNA (uracil(1939)-C(5))-methyltransferase RlmD [Lachnospiraceae bacterium]|nr:23S rRNA (uracil(1939)-C(5))-methyltransferase RlmD [Lachnospiraceae bacterium]